MKNTFRTGATALFITCLCACSAPGPQYRNVGKYSEGLAPVQAQSGKWGFINQRQEWVIQPRFDEAKGAKLQLNKATNGASSINKATGNEILQSQRNQRNRFPVGARRMGLSPRPEARETSHAARRANADSPRLTQRPSCLVELQT